MPQSLLLKEILDDQLEMVCRFQADGTILFANRAYAASLGQDADTLVGSNLWDFVTGEDRQHVEDQLALLKPDARTLTIENRLETANGTRWMLWRNHALLFDEQGHWLEAQSTAIDITDRKQLEQQLTLVIEELNHRVKNTLMVVQSLAWQTFRDAALPDGVLTAFNERLAALASAHTTLSRAGWIGTDLAEAVQHSLPVRMNADRRIVLRGPDTIVPANMTVPLIMAVHELATNAIKYGALSSPDGSVLLSWDVESPSGRLVITWHERGGPEVEVPGQTGFGTRLITEMVSRQLGGEVQIEYATEGLSCRMAFPLDQVTP